MTDSTASVNSAPSDLNHASLDQLEEMLTQAEENLQAIYKEIDARRRETLEDQFSQLPADMSSFKGSWRNLVTAFRQAVHRDGASPDTR